MSPAAELHLVGIRTSPGGQKLRDKKKQQSIRTEPLFRFSTLNGNRQATW